MDTPAPSRTVTGRIDVHPRGYGFLVVHQAWLVNGSGRERYPVGPSSRAGRVRPMSSRDDCGLPA